jgi:hypothetical protein
VNWIRIRSLLLHDLYIQSPPRKVTALDAFKQVALITLTIVTNKHFGFSVREVLDSLLSLEGELNPVALAIRIDEAERMTTEAVHVTKRPGNAAVSHNDRHLMQCLGQKRPEIPVVIRASHSGPGIALDRMVQVWKLEGIAKEKDRSIVTNQRANISVVLPTLEKMLAFVYRVMSCVTVKVP